MRQKLGGALLAALALGAACLLPVLAADKTGKAAEQIVILCTNDVHCETDQWKDKDGTVENLGYPGVSAYRQEMEALCGAENVTLVDAGDAIQGSAIGTLSDGAYLVELMNQVGYDYAVPGNHEFDYGMDSFLALAAGKEKKADYTYLCANFRDKDGKLVFQPYEVVDYGPVQVAYVGISTPETISKSTPVYFQDENGRYIYSFGGDGTQLYEDVQSAVDQARKEGADYVVAVAHLGQTGITKAWRSDEVVAHTTGIDVMFDGHSHESYQQQVKNKDGEEVLVLQTGHNLAALGKVTIDADSGEIAGELVTGYDGSEEKTAALLESIHARLDEKLEAQIGTLAVDLTAEDEQENQLVRSQETNLGDFCADAYRTQLHADVALVNGGGIRANVAKGTVTYGDIINVHPYNNQLSVAEVTGQQLLDALEMGARLYPEPCGGFLQVSGMTYEIDLSVPSHVVTDEKSFFVKVDGEYRVKNVTVGGAPLDLEKTYRVASHDYMLKQDGDGMTMFRNCSFPASEVMLDNQALIGYVQDELGGVIGTGYENRDGQGRIRASLAPAEPDQGAGKEYSDVSPEHWAYDDISFVSGRGLFQGSAGAFSPEAAMTRGMLAVTLHNLAGAPAGSSSSSFPDADGAWYTQAVCWAAAQGVMTGYPDGTFGPDDPVTREQLAAVLYRYAGSPASSSELEFADASRVSGYAVPAVRWAAEQGILTGKPGGLLDPDGGASRAETAVMLARYLKTDR